MTPEKNKIVAYFLEIINDKSAHNIALLHYITSNKHDYFILLKTTDEMHAGKIFEVEQQDYEFDEDCINYVYEEIPFDYFDEVFYYFIDDLVMALIDIVINKRIVVDYIYSYLIRQTYQFQHIHQYLNRNDNIQYLRQTKNQP